MSTRYKLNIDKPCSENWNAMIPASHGKFCQQCSKNVIDFSMMSDRQIHKYLKNSSGNLCGRLHQTQLNREIFKQRTYNRFQKPFYKYMLSLLFLGFTENTFSFSQNRSLNIKIEKNFSSNREVKIDSLSKKDEIPISKIYGNVKDSLSEVAIPFANVILIQRTVEDSIQIGGTITDFDGNFSISPIHLEELDGEVYLSISYVGYHSKEILLLKPFHRNKIDIFLNSDPNYEESGTVVYGGVCIEKKEKRWWQFWRQNHNH